MGWPLQVGGTAQKPEVERFGEVEWESRRPRSYPALVGGAGWPWQGRACSSFRREMEKFWVEVKVMVAG